MVGFPVKILCKTGPCERVPDSAAVLRTFPNHLLLGNQDKGSSLSHAHSLALPHGPGLHNLTGVWGGGCVCVCVGSGLPSRVYEFWVIWPQKDKISKLNL